MNKKEILIVSWLQCIWLLPHISKHGHGHHLKHFLHFSILLNHLFFFVLGDLESYGKHYCGASTTCRARDRLLEATFIRKEENFEKFSTNKARPLRDKLSMFCVIICLTYLLIRIFLFKTCLQNIFSTNDNRNLTYDQLYI